MVNRLPEASGCGVTGGTKGIRDAGVSERHQHGGRPVDG